MNTTTFCSIIRKESDRTLAALREILNETDARWRDIKFSCMATGVKARLTKRLATIGVDFTVAGLLAMPSVYRKAIMDEAAYRTEQASEKAVDKAWTYCAEHHQEVVDFLNGGKLHYQYWAGTGRHKRLAYTKAETLMNNIRRADASIQYEVRNDAPRGGEAGKHYVYTGDKAWADSFKSRLLMVCDLEEISATID